MHLDVAVLKLMSNESELAKKKMQFSGLLFFYRSLKLAHLHFGPKCSTVRNKIQCRQPMYPIFLVLLSNL